MGESDKPLARYSTSEMAKDTLEVISYLQWTLPRQLHVVGVSMGGMIAQELVGTHDPGKNSFPDSRVHGSTPGQHSRILGEPTQPHKYVPSIPKAPDDQLDDMKDRMFSHAWLDAPDDYGEFPSNGDRFAAMELKKRQDVEGFTRKGFICQAIAAGWHYKSPQQLKELADRVGRERIQVLHGTLDKMITVPQGLTLAKELGDDEGVTKIIVDGRGHVLHIEERDMYIKALESIVEKTDEMR
ncbi:MAG: hypothetical protein Q9216_005032 [Gyalolechia sp. 2 TL-2023]